MNKMGNWSVITVGDQCSGMFAFARTIHDQYCVSEIFELIEVGPSLVCSSCGCLPQWCIHNYANAHLTLVHLTTTRCLHAHHFFSTRNPSQQSYFYFFHYKTHLISSFVSIFSSVNHLLSYNSALSPKQHQAFHTTLQNFPLFNKHQDEAFHHCFRLRCRGIYDAERLPRPYSGSWPP